jgi:hypothetical protein
MARRFLSPEDQASRRAILTAVRRAELGEPVARTSHRGEVLAAVRELARPAMVAPSVRAVAAKVGISAGTTVYHLRELANSGHLVKDDTGGYVPANPDHTMCDACGGTGFVAVPQ